MSRVFLAVTLAAGVLGGSGCVATAAICASWLAAPCIICFGDGSGQPNQSMAVVETSFVDDVEAPSDEQSMTY